MYENEWQPFAGFYNIVITFNDLLRLLITVSDVDCHIIYSVSRFLLSFSIFLLQFLSFLLSGYLLICLHLDDNE